MSACSCPRKPVLSSSFEHRYDRAGYDFHAHVPIKMCAPPLTIPRGTTWKYSLRSAKLKVLSMRERCDFSFLQLTIDFSTAFGFVYVL